MKERPILFSAPMIRAILEDRKTVTRRVVKPTGAVDVIPFIGRDNQPTGEFGWCPHPCYIEKHIRCPYGQPGDRLWVRETWGQLYPLLCDDEPVFWRADYSDQELREQLLPKWRPSIHMFRWASRITLEVTAVRVERLQDIGEDQAAAEGIHRLSVGSGYQDRFSAEPVTWADVVERDAGHEDACLAFRDLWESINGPGSWKANPWVWAVEFKRVEAQTA